MFELLLSEPLLERGSPLPPRQIQERLVAIQQQVERDKGGWLLLREPRNAVRVLDVHAPLQMLKSGRLAVLKRYDLSIQDERLFGPSG